MPNRTVELEDAPAVQTEARLRTPHQRGLLAIGFFKLLNSLFYILLGFGALHLVHKDLGEQIMRLALLLHRNPEERFVQFLVLKAGLVDAHRLRQIGAITFIYAGLHCVEGLGLILEKGWAEYLTLVITGGFLPWEFYEVFRHPSWLRLALLIINLAVLGYLIYVLAQKRAADAKPV